MASTMYCSPKYAKISQSQSLLELFRIIRMALESVINIELQKVCDWLNANKLTINAKKSNFVIFRPSQKKLSYQINIRICNNASKSDIFLECKDYVKFLGVRIEKT